MKKTLLLILSVISITTNAQNLVYQYNFDGDTLDSSANNNTLESFGTGNPYGFSQGQSGNNLDSCVYFENGKGLKTTVPFNNVGWTGTAVAFWLKAGTDNNGYIIQAGTGFGVQFQSSNVSCFFDGSSSASLVSTTNNLNDGNWHHVVCQNDGVSTEIYIDGVFNTSQNEVMYDQVTPTHFYMGMTSNFTADIASYIDELRIYDYLLTQNQIENLGNPTANIIADQKLTSELTISPNPTNEKIHIQTTSNILSVSLYDMNASKILSQTESEVNLQAFKTGTYLVEIKTDKGTIMKKVIKN